MKLTYSILWFDDNDEYLESLDKEYIKGEFTKWGFYCDIKFVTDPVQFTSESPYRKFDLIVVDYSLDPYDGHGQDFIRLVRDQNVLTDVIFYSSHPASDLWDAIRQEELEGIFVSNRANSQDKILKVANQAIRKVLDLENVRGIVMAEVGNNDELLSNIARKSFEELNEKQRTEIIKKYIDAIIKQTDSLSEKASSLEGTTEIDALLNLLDSSKKWNLCQTLSKFPDTTFSLKGKGDYFIDVLDKRNKLAHGVPTQHDSDALKFEYCGKEYIFNDDESLILRENLRKYGELFQSVVDNYA